MGSMKAETLDAGNTSLCVPDWDHPMSYLTCNSSTDLYDLPSVHFPLGSRMDVTSMIEMQWRSARSSERANRPNTFKANKLTKTKVSLFTFQKLPSPWVNKLISICKHRRAFVRLGVWSVRPALFLQHASPFTDKDTIWNIYTYTPIDYIPKDRVLPSPIQDVDDSKLGSERYFWDGVTKFSNSRQDFVLYVRTK